jgi:hypothetical protein
MIALGAESQTDAVVCIAQQLIHFSLTREEEPDRETLRRTIGISTRALRQNIGEARTAASAVLH